MEKMLTGVLLENWKIKEKEVNLSGKNKNIIHFKFNL